MTDGGHDPRAAPMSQAASTPRLVGPPTAECQHSCCLQVWMDGDVVACYGIDAEGLVAEHVRELMLEGMLEGMLVRGVASVNPIDHPDMEWVWRWGDVDG